MNSAGFADHFSGHAAAYARSRPRYPASLLDWVASTSPATDCVWDCATGNGQAAVPLVQRFDQVLATDGSLDQLAEAPHIPRVQFVAGLAERAPLAPRSVDACTVAQAAHWFDLDAFWQEVRRVVRPGGIVAIWCYVMFRVDDAVDGVIGRLYNEILANSWPRRRHHVETAYREIEMPFEELDTPPFTMHRDWTFAQVCAYLQTWSASQRYRQDHTHDPVAMVRADLQAAWGGGEREVVWPVYLRAGRVSG